MFVLKISGILDISYHNKLIYILKKTLYVNIKREKKSDICYDTLAEVNVLHTHKRVCST